MKIVRRKGREGWQLDCGLLMGRRVRISFGSRDEAEKEMRRRRALLAAEGKAAFSLSAAEQRDYLLAVEQLAEVGATLQDAVKLYLAQRPAQAVQLSVRAVAEGYLTSREKGGRSRRYLRTLSSSLRGLCVWVGEELPVVQLTREQVQDWLQGNGWQPKTVHGHLGNVSAMLAWAVREGALVRNVCERIEAPQLVQAEVQHYSVQTCAELLRLTDTDEWRWALPALVLGLFCGLRPEREVAQMPWADVRLEERVVIVTAGRSKTRQRRVVDIPEVAVAWLRKCLAEPLLQAGKVVPPRWDKRWVWWRKGIGYHGRERWPHDVLRHTYATYHLAHHGDEARLQLLMGHTSARMLYQHYRGLATRAEAAQFWQLMPGTV